MSKERYTVLYTSSKALASQDAPVLIEATALMKDNQENKLLALGKIRNISGLVIRAVTVGVRSLDPYDNSSCHDSEHVFDFLSFAHGALFGEKQPMPMADTKAKACIVHVKEIIFENGTVWNASASTQWRLLPDRAPIESSIPNEKDRKGYRLLAGNSAKYLYQKNGQFHFCPCGAVSTTAVESCYQCGILFSTIANITSDDLNHAVLYAEGISLLQARIDCASLNKAKSIFLSLGDYKDAPQKAAECDETIAKITAKAEEAKRAATYTSALTLLNLRESLESVTEAKNIFLSLGDYKDAPQKAAECEAVIARLIQEKEEAKRETAYAQAATLLKANESIEQLTQAKRIFASLGSYKNAHEQADLCDDAMLRFKEKEELAHKEALYAPALATLRKNSSLRALTLAKETFFKLGDYKDSAKLAEECDAKILALYNKTSLSSFGAAIKSATVRSGKAVKSATVRSGKAIKKFFLGTKTRKVLTTCLCILLIISATIAGFVIFSPKNNAIRNAKAALDENRIVDAVDILLDAGIPVQITYHYNDRLDSLTVTDTYYTADEFTGLRSTDSALKKWKVDYTVTYSNGFGIFLELYDVYS